MSQPSSSTGNTSGEANDDSAARIAALEARIADLEAAQSTQRSGAGRTSRNGPDDDRSRRHRTRDEYTTEELNEQLDDLQRGLADLRSKRSELAERLHDLRADPASDPEDIADTARQLRLHDARYRELAARHAALSRELDARMRGFAPRTRAYSPYERPADPGYAGASYSSGDAYAAAPYAPGVMPLIAGATELARLGHAIALGHVGMVSEALGAGSTLAGDVHARAAGRAGNPMDFSLGFGPDLLASHWTAADRLASAPRRVADAVYQGYTGGRAPSDPV